ncbi:MAG: anti-sigma factor [Trichocoleus desertorum ATA4-8-CV12]|jgi:anti-sigma-K factor RskA|nr:anti-sigma factor [Trichocoleus desertorum ATA4-8-CV12]
MTESWFSEQVEELIIGYVLEDLSPEETEEFQQLLADHPEIGSEVARLREVLALLPYSLPELQLPARLRSAILASARTASSRPVRSRSPFRWSLVGTGIAALLALGLGLDNYRLRQELLAARSRNTVITLLQEPSTRLLTLVGTEQATTASGSVVINLNAQTAVIVLKNLPAPAGDQIYRLWAINQEQKIPCGQFAANSQGMVLNQLFLPDPACSSAASTLAVSLEPIPSPPQPVGPIVMTGRI